MIIDSFELLNGVFSVIYTNTGTRGRRFQKAFTEIYKGCHMFQYSSICTETHNINKKRLKYCILYFSHYLVIC